jgi:hypothetical protein
MPKKETTINELAGMVQNGFLEMGDRMDSRFNGVEKEMKLMRQDIEEVRLRLDNVAYRFELEELKFNLEKRLRIVESKLKIKPASA